MNNQSNGTFASSIPHNLSLEEVQKFFELSLDLISISDRQGRIRYLNPAWEKSLGWTREEMLDRPFFEFVHPDDRERTRTVFEELFSGHNAAYFENRCLSSDGSYHILQWSIPAVPADSHLAYASARDNTERRKVDELLRESEERYRIVVESTGQLIYDYDIATGNIVWTGAVGQITGYSPEEFTGMNIEQWEENIHEGDRAQAMELLTEAMRTRSQYRVEYRFRHKQGHYLYIADTGLCLYDDDGRPYRMLGTMSDITPVVAYEQSLQESEARLRASLHDKELLLREIHHRVKNNLQIISSLLNLQAAQVDEKNRALFRESRDRIRSMALIHEQLYATDDLACIHVADYLRQLTTNLWRSYGSSDVILKLDIDNNTLLDIDLAVPCGLIVTELVSNAMKYAFTGRDAGTISIGFSTDDTRYTLHVADNGCGLPDNIQPATVRTLGLQLVETLVHQLGGDMSIGRTAGTVFTIVFPVK